jgi:hypothetical protein
MNEHLLRRSNVCLKEASNGYLSPLGVLDSLFEAGYAAVLSTLPMSVARQHDHPAIALVPKGVASRFLELEYSGCNLDEFPSSSELLQWALDQRKKVGWD